MFTNGDVKNCAQHFREMLFVHMDNFWNLLFQLFKHGPNTLHVAFYIFVEYSSMPPELILSRTPLVPCGIDLPARIGCFLMCFIPNLSF
jgi:hypothetical protein